MFSPRWLVILAWSTGLAGLYVLLSLAHAALVEGIFSVDVGFGRALAFWVGSIYLGLLGWGFLPAHPCRWYARRPPVLSALAVGTVGGLMCAALTGFWLAAHWTPAVGGPVIASIVALLVGALALLWLAGRDESRRGRGEAPE